MDMNMGMHSTSATAPTASASQTPQTESATSYFAYGEHSGTILAHIGFMILAWCFVLPAGNTVNSASIETIH